MSPSYTTPHYVLMAISVVVVAIFVGGLVYLVMREKHKLSMAKKEHIRSLLGRRRKGISAGPKCETQISSPSEKSQMTQVQMNRSFYGFPTRLVSNTQAGGKSGRADTIAPL
ncbi:hypothetical protein PoB_007191000 [Plakobranchus ocellatus]|uniref:Uncharacterized protein n=1 Tax=Plakobranchus ocellatus TaxID=259542 RepID=A0AAV4DMZ9_9GAST|nr:hypothetical protein PoB_007191000 [Plakobranchus ocellatus]